jgi:putative DNA primase/helicase
VAIKERFPHASIYQVADNDLKEQLSKGQNGGVTKALEAANAVNGNVLIPPVKKDEANEISDWNDLEIKYGTQHCFDILNNLLHEISAYKKIEMTKSTPDKPNLLAHQIHSRVPEISLKKTTNALDPSVFTTWLINKLDEKSTNLLHPIQQIIHLKLQVI